MRLFFSKTLDIGLMVVMILSSQAECDELGQRAEALKEENANLRTEVNRIRSEYDQLLSENASLKVMQRSFFNLMDDLSLNFL